MTEPIHLERDRLVRELLETVAEHREQAAVVASMRGESEIVLTVAQACPCGAYHGHRLRVGESWRCELCFTVVDGPVLPQ